MQSVEESPGYVSEFCDPKSETQKSRSKYIRFFFMFSMTDGQNGHKCIKILCQYEVRQTKVQLLYSDKFVGDGVYCQHVAGGINPDRGDKAVRPLGWLHITLYHV